MQCPMVWFGTSPWSQANVHPSSLLSLILLLCARATTSASPPYSPRSHLPCLGLCFVPPSSSSSLQQRCSPELCRRSLTCSRQWRHWPGWQTPSVLLSACRLGSSHRLPVHSQLHLCSSRLVLSHICTSTAAAGTELTWQALGTSWCLSPLPIARVPSRPALPAL